jgi:hypothetical protein
MPLVDFIMDWIAPIIGGAIIGAIALWCGCPLGLAMLFAFVGMFGGQIVIGLLLKGIDRLRRKSTRK